MIVTRMAMSLILYTTSFPMYRVSSAIVGCAIAIWQGIGAGLVCLCSSMFCCWAVPCCLKFFRAMLFKAINPLAFLCGASWMMDTSVAHVTMRPLVIVGIVAMVPHG